MRRMAIFWLMLSLAACNGSTGVVEQSGDTQDGIGQSDGKEADLSDPVDSTASDVVDVTGDVAADLFGPGDLDAGPDVPVPQCDPGEGCFLDGCEDNEDCQSGWCVQHLGESVCSKTCQQECPVGWTCSQVAGTDPDVVYICVSRYANLCRPCATNDNCKSVGGADDACLNYGPDGNFCGGGCGADESCPWGFACEEIETVDGALLKQCVNETGECPCTDRSVELGLATPCAVANEFGTCGGQRLCVAEGLSDCDAAVPAPEVCNGIDDDCDGDIDEPDLVGGDFVNLCNDDNDCTEDECTGAEGCVNNLLNEGQCNDDNPCTVADHCVDGACVGAAVECDDGNVCTDDVCTDTGGCEFPPVEGKCDDADPCTVGDVCEAGECVGESVPCQCLEDGDCGALEDGDLCNGTLICDDDWPPYECVVDADSVVTCPAAQGVNAPCLEAACDPATGACSQVPAHDGAACDDGDACTYADVCANGVCVGGSTLNCNDGNGCTDDACDPDSGCVHTNNEAVCNDGNVCTTQDQCEAGECAGGPALSCDDGNACNGAESCDEAVGCVSGEALQCDDGDVCNGNEGCDPATGCTSGGDLNCNDGNPCTADSCDGQLGCVHEATDGDCDDGNACTVGDHCQGGACVKGGLLNCNDDNVCTNDTCDPDSGCVTTLNSAPCDDGDLCTIGDVCKLGECGGTGTLVCDDGNVCTDDACAPEAGCQFTPNAAQCDDGSVCTEGDACKAGWCQPGGPLDCDDGNDCTTDLCLEPDGCQHASVENGSPCVDEGVDKICLDGICSCAPDCEGKECGPDGCGGSCGSCADEDACTLDEQCVDGLCESTPLICSDDNGCTDDTCDPGLGCVFTNNSVACDDGNPCTANDTCSAGECAGEAVPNLDPFEFTHAGATGRNGPNQTQLNNAYSGTSLAGDVSSQGGIQKWTVPYTGTYTIKAAGARGGWGGGNGSYPTTKAGSGALVTGDFDLAAGTELYVVVGQMGALSLQPCCVNYGCSGGGGASWVYTDANGAAPLLVAGGGGGQAENGTGGDGSNTTTPNPGTNGSGNSGAGGVDGNGGKAGSTGCDLTPGGGGGGWLSNGQTAPTIRNPGGEGGHAPRNDAQGGFGTHNNYGAEHCSGGFGGGGAGSDNTGAGGGGGGFNGGGGGRDYCNGNWGAGGGGGSFNAGNNASAQSGANANHGYVTITFECSQ